MGVSRSWFYKWMNDQLPPRAARREALEAEVRRLFKAHRGTYGSPRITADLREAGWKVSKNTVAAIMREQGLAARCKRRRRATTRPGKGRWWAPDLVKRDFPARQVNRKWYGDGTEIATGEGKLYLASVMDMASRWRRRTRTRPGHPAHRAHHHRHPARPTSPAPGQPRPHGFTTGRHPAPVTSGDRKPRSLSHDEDSQRLSCLLGRFPQGWHLDAARYPASADPEPVAIHWESKFCWDR